MRIIIMGTGPFAVPTAQRLKAEGHQIPLVVTRPLSTPPPKKLPPRPVCEWAIAENLDIFEPRNVNDHDALAHLQKHAPDLLFVCDYGQILSSECLQVARLGGINLHGSLLPRHRGAAPVQWALLRGDTQTGVTVIHMTPGLDAGPALAFAQSAIEPDETAEQLEPRLARLGIGATLAAVDCLAKWDGHSSIGVMQDRSLVTKAPRFAKADGELDFRLPAEYLVRLVRACQPWPGTFAELQWSGGKRIRVLVRSARSLAESPPELQAAEPGAAIAMTAEQLGVEWSSPFQRMIGVKCGQGTLLIGRLQPAGKREMSAEEFMRGHPLEAMASFQLPATPLTRLDM